MQMPSQQQPNLHPWALISQYEITAAHFHAFFVRILPQLTTSPPPKNMSWLASSEAQSHPCCNFPDHLSSVLLQQSSGLIKHQQAENGKHIVTALLEMHYTSIGALQLLPVVCGCHAAQKHMTHFR